MQASASAPALPPVAPQSSVPAHVRAAQQRGQREASKRKDFLGGLINQAPNGVTEQGCRLRYTVYVCMYVWMYVWMYVYVLMWWTNCCWVREGGWVMFAWHLFKIRFLYNGLIVDGRRDVWMAWHGFANIAVTQCGLHEFDRSLWFARRVWFDMRGAWADLNIYFFFPYFWDKPSKAERRSGGFQRVSLEKVVFPMEKSTESALGAAK